MSFVRSLCPSVAMGIAIGMVSGYATAFMTPTVSGCGAICKLTVTGGQNPDRLASSAASQDGQLLANATQPRSGLAAGLHSTPAITVDPSPFSALMTPHAAGSDRSSLATLLTTAGYPLSSPSVATGAGTKPGIVSLIATSPSLQYFGISAANAAENKPGIVSLIASLKLTAPGALLAGGQAGTQQHVVFQTPAPGTLVLLGLGALGLYGIQRRNRRRVWTR